MDLSPVQLLRDHLETFVDRLTLRLNAAMPGYARLERSALRASVHGFTVDLLSAVELHDSGRLAERMNETAAARVKQGLSLAEYMQALFMAPPVCREIIREVGPRNDPNIAKGFADLEVRMYDLTVMAANIYAEVSAKQLRAKNLELNRLNQTLQGREKTLAEEGVKVSRALASANEFNARVIESLTSGVLVVATGTRIVTLYSQRMEAITGIPAEEVLGREAPAAFAKVKGIDHEMILQTVRATGSFPLTKIQIVNSAGLKRVVFLRAQRMYGLEGEVEGTVVLVDDVSERELLIDSFSRYVSRDLLTRLLSRAEPMRLEGEKRTCTVLFADIRGFTGLAEHMPPEALHQLLNEFLHVMVESIIEHGGFIDKFVGDKVMALFAGPRPLADAALSAVEASRSILSRIAAQNASRVAGGQDPIEVGIGINTGPVVIGNIGDEARMDFTAIGDSVNVADRLQSLAKGGQLLVGGGTAELIRDRVKITDLGAQSVKGRVAPVLVFEVVR